MKLFGLEIKRHTKRNHRNYQAAKSDRLTSDWLTTNLVSDEILRWQLPTLRNRSRDLAINNDHMKNFLRKLKINVVGPNGINFQSKARVRNGDLDKGANQKIEESWHKWTKKENASVCSTLSLRDCLNTIIESTARDGEIIVRKVRGYDNKFRFALQLIEADYLDEKLNQNLPNGNVIRLGIEKNRFGKPVAYHLLEKHPGDHQSNIGQKYIRIPAEEIIHIFMKERPTQSRGAPWAHTAILRLRMLGAYEEASLVAARVGASKMGFIKPSLEGSGYQGDDTDIYGNQITEVEPGLIELLPPGADFTSFDPGQPSGEFQFFQKAMLRGIASGLGCSYNSLANDLEGVNFSSLRSGLLEERDSWKAMQTWFIENFLDELFPTWLEMAILSGNLDLDYSDIDRLIAPKWQGRRWEWVDPEKDINARVIANQNGLTTRTRICAEQGEDFEEILEELAEEKKMIEGYGLNLDTEKLKPKAQTQTDETDETISSTGGNGKKAMTY